MTIPIRNLYYLFCYAWQRFPPGGAVEAGVDAAPDLPNLFARLLVNDVNALLRRGLDRGYRTFVEETRAPRGRLLLDAIVKEQTLRRGAVVCAVDELTPDVVHNRIIKAAARLLARTRGLEPALVHELGAIALKLQAVSDVRLDANNARWAEELGLRLANAPAGLALLDIHERRLDDLAAVSARRLEIHHPQSHWSSRLC